ADDLRVVDEADGPLDLLGALLTELALLGGRDRRAAAENRQGRDDAAAELTARQPRRGPGDERAAHGNRWSHDRLAFYGSRRDAIEKMWKRRMGRGARAGAGATAAPRSARSPPAAC